MAYNMSKNEILNQLRENAEYFPFEQIRSYHLLKKNEGHIPIEPSLEASFMEFFEDVISECKKLVSQGRGSENIALWEEAIQKMEAILG